ncbi:MAG: hypothetical protein ACL7AX_10325 [Candidatus Arsenophonus phytopathogenicus]
MMLLFDSRFSRLQSLMENYGHIKKKLHFGGYCILVNHVIIGQVLDGEFYLLNFNLKCQDCKTDLYQERRSSYIKVFFYQ